MTLRSNYPHGTISVLIPLPEKPLENPITKNVSKEHFHVIDNESFADIRIDNKSDELNSEQISYIQECLYLIPQFDDHRVYHANTKLGQAKRNAVGMTAATAAVAFGTYKALKSDTSNKSLEIAGSFLATGAMIGLTVWAWSKIKNEITNLAAHKQARMDSDSKAHRMLSERLEDPKKIDKFLNEEKMRLQ